MDERLLEAARARRLVLFVGAGVSEHLSLPSWDGLTDQVASQLGFEPAIFRSHGGPLELFEYYSLEQGSLGPLRSWMDQHWHHGISVEHSEVHRLIVDLNFPKIYTTNF